MHSSASPPTTTAPCASSQTSCTTCRSRTRLLRNRASYIRAAQRNQPSAECFTPERTKTSTCILYKDKTALTATRDTWKDVYLYYSKLNGLSSIAAVEKAVGFWGRPKSLRGDESYSGFLLLHEILTGTLRMRLKGATTPSYARSLLSLYSDKESGGLLGSIVHIFGATAGIMQCTVEGSFENKETRASPGPRTSPPTQTTARA